MLIVIHLFYLSLHQLPTITGTRTVADTEFFVTKLDYARDGPSGTTGAHAAVCYVCVYTYTHVRARAHTRIHTHT